jgi:hypothetical protein
LCIAVVIVSSLACNRSRRQRDGLVERQLRHEPGLVARIRPEDHGLARRQPDAEARLNLPWWVHSTAFVPAAGRVTVRSRSAWSEAWSAASSSNYGEPVGRS